MARNETGASSGFAPPFPVSSRRHLQTRVPPRASTETTAPVSSHARTSVTASPCAWPRNAAARAKVTREETPASRAARSTSHARAPASGDAITTRSGGGSPRGVPRPESAESPSCVPSARFMRGRAHVAEKYAGDAECASRARELSARPESTSSSTGARRQRCARGTRADARSPAVASKPSSIHTHTAPSDPSAARKSAPSRAGTAAAPNPKASDSDTRVRERPSPGVSGEDGSLSPSARAAEPRSRRALRGSGRHASQCAATSAGPYPDGPGSVCTTTVCARRTGASVATRSLAAGPHAVHTRAAPSSEVVTSATVFVKEIEAVPRERKASGVSGVSSFQRADVTAVGCRRVCARYPRASQTRAKREPRAADATGAETDAPAASVVCGLPDVSATTRQAVRTPRNDRPYDARSRGLSASSSGASVSSTRHARSSPSAAAETNAVPSLVQAAATTFAAHLARPTLSHARRRERGEEREGALVSSVSSSSSRSAGAHRCITRPRATRSAPRVSPGAHATQLGGSLSRGDDPSSSPSASATRENVEGKPTCVSATTTASPEGYATCAPLTEAPSASKSTLSAPVGPEGMRSRTSSRGENAEARIAPTRPRRTSRGWTRPPRPALARRRRGK